MGRGEKEVEQEGGIEILINQERRADSLTQRGDGRIACEGGREG